MKIAATKFSVIDALYLLIIIGCLGYAIQTGPVFHPDSQGYIDMALNRSIGYSVFVAFHELLFGTNCFTVLVISQFAFLCVAAVYFVKALKSTLGLTRLAGLFIFSVLLLPVVYELKVASSITSESIAYPLYLLVLYHLLHAIGGKRQKNFLWAFVFLLLLLSVRGQFLFVVPVTGALVLFGDLRFSISKPKAIVLTGLLLTVFLSVATDVVFHKIRHGYAVTTPWTGIQIAALPFFVSDAKDSVAFDSPLQKDYFNHVYRQLSEKKLLLGDVPEETEEIGFYYDNYIRICNGTLNSDGEAFFPNTENADQKTILNDHVAASVAVPLLFENFPQWSLMYIRNLCKGFSTAQNLFAFLSLLFFSVALYAKSQKTEIRILVFFCLLLLGNILLVALAEPVINRYAFYNHWILVVILLFLLQKSFLKPTHA